MSAGPQWFRLARRDVGTREFQGSRHNPKVLSYYRAVGHGWVDDDETAWCAAFVGACLERSGIKSTRSLRARSYETWGQRLRRPKLGCIAVLSRGRDPAYGHVGFFVRDEGEHIVLLGGNQSNAVNQRKYAKSRVLSWRWPAVESVTPMGPQSTEFEAALRHVLEFEGQYSNHPSDPGGPTYRGVTIGRLAGHLGVRITRSNRSSLIDRLKSLTEGQIRTLYWQHYWIAASADEMPDGLSLMLFDAAVQHGPVRAIKMMQRVIGVEADGEVGPITLAAVRASFLPNVVRAFGEHRRSFYRSLKHFKHFGRGWIRRLDVTIKRGLAAAPTRAPFPPDVSSQPQIQPAEDDTRMQTEQKWWAQSLTIWGTLITALSTVLPIIGPFVGLDVSSAMVREFGDAVAVLIQALGGVTGTLMAVYGRVRATTALTQRPVNLKV